MKLYSTNNLPSTHIYFFFRHNHHWFSLLSSPILILPNSGAFSSHFIINSIFHAVESSFCPLIDIKWKWQLVNQHKGPYKAKIKKIIMKEIHNFHLSLIFFHTGFIVCCSWSRCYASCADSASHVCIHISMQKATCYGKVYFGHE